MRKQGATIENRPTRSSFQEFAAAARAESSASDCASVIACSSVIVEPAVVSCSQASSPSNHELPFEVAFELVLCWEVRVHHDGGVLAGEPRRAQPVWTIFFAPSFTSRTLDERQIAEASWQSDELPSALDS
jgi:hypothetical protein